jgi:hypothetical protein
MSSSHKIEKQSDLLIGLLTTQCADLEIMVTLEQAEIFAAQSGDYQKVIKIISEREILCEKIETFQRQITKLRERLGKNVELVWESNIAARMAEVVQCFMLQNEDKQLLLEIARKKSVSDSNSAAHLQRISNLYLREKHSMLIFDQAF